MPHFSKNEFRRKYLKSLTAEVEQRAASKKEARRALDLVLHVLEQRAARGEVIDFGFVKIKPIDIPPRLVVSGLDGKRHYKGGSKKWVVKWSQKWLRRLKPEWSHFF